MESASDSLNYIIKGAASAHVGNKIADAIEERIGITPHADKVRSERDKSPHSLKR